MVNGEKKLRRADDCNGHVLNVDTIAGLLITGMNPGAIPIAIGTGP